jgi:hypothetical protein
MSVGKRFNRIACIRTCAEDPSVMELLESARLVADVDLAHDQGVQYVL